MPHLLVSLGLSHVQGQLRRLSPSEPSLGSWTPFYLLPPPGPPHSGTATFPRSPEGLGAWGLEWESERGSPPVMLATFRRQSV